MAFELLDRCPICLGAGPFKEVGAVPIRLVGGTITYVRCLDCSGEFHNPMWTRETTAEWYASGSYLRAIPPPRYEVPQVDKRMRFLGRHIKHVSRFLELGSGNGHLLRAVAETYGAETVAIEADPSRAKASNAPDSVTGGFDLIASIHSLEHCPRPLETLGNLVSRLDPGGRVLIEVPIMGGYLVKYNESHPIAFTGSAMLKMTGMLGLRLMAFGEPGHPAGFLGLYERNDYAQSAEKLSAQT